MSDRDASAPIQEAHQLYWFAPPRRLFRRLYSTPPLILPPFFAFSLSLSIFHHGSNSPTDSFRFFDPGGFSIDGSPAKVAEAASLPGGSEDFNGSSHLSVPVLRRREETGQQTQAAGADRTGRKYACLILEQKIAIWTKTIELPD